VIKSLQDNHPNKTFPPKGPENPLSIEYGDLIEYGCSIPNVTVMIYACRWSENHMIYDGNVACSMSQVTRIVKKSALGSF